MTQSSDNRWLFDLNRLKNSPSARDGIGESTELILRQRGTNLIREMAQLLKLRPVVMHTGMVYFHRFFTLRSFARFDAYRMAVCSLYLASKWDDQPIFQKHIIQLLLTLKEQKFPKESYKRECELLVDNEAEMLFTFGFELTVTHAHTLIAQDFDSPVISRLIQKNAYIIASDLLRLTTVCLQFNPPFIACICIYLASTILELPINSNNWCSIIDPTISLSDVQREAQQFKKIINPSHLSLTDKKSIHRCEAFGSSPESAYSSGAPESPDLNNDEQPQNLKPNITFKCDQSEDVKPNINALKKRAFEIMGNRLQARQKIETKTPFVQISKPLTPLEKTTSLLKNASLSGSLTCIKQSNVHQSHHSSSNASSNVSSNGHKRHIEDQDRAKYQKVVKTNGDIVRRPVHQSLKVSGAKQVIDPKNTAVRPSATVRSGSVTSAAVKQTKSFSQTAVNHSQSTKLYKNGFKSLSNLNLKITISANNETEAAKRVVSRSEPLVNSNQNSKVS